MKGAAIFDPTAIYRYLLWRQWDEALPAIGFIMLNPSTAEGITNDPTIRRCLGLARQWGYGSLWVGNLFAYRTPYPAKLLQVSDPIGIDNDSSLRQLSQQVHCLILAWGDRGVYLNRSRVVQQLLSVRAPFYCLGKTRTSQPRHPLYVRKGVEPIPV